MFKKILVCLLPLVTLVGCNNGGGPNPPEPSKYTLTVNCTDCTPLGNKSEYEEGASVSFTITPKYAYTLPEKKDVQVTGVSSFEYTIDSGIATFSCVMPAKAVTVTITATKQPEPTVDTPLYIANLGDDVTIQYYFHNNDIEYTLNLQYSLDQKEWKSLNIVSKEKTDIAKLSKGETIYFRGNNPNSFCRYTENRAYFRFVLDNPSGDTKLKIGGNIMSLLSTDNYANKKDIPCDGCFHELFCEFKSENENYTQGVETSDIDASELLLPATEIKPYTYWDMFYYSSISKAPLNLPATSAAKGMYESMFYGCENLATAPIINLNNLLESSCRLMFHGCSNLDITKDSGKTKIFTCPDTSATDCVYHMFYETKQIIEADPQPNEVFYYN